MNDLLASLRGALPGLWKHRWSGLAATVAAGLAAAVFIALLPAKYEASTRVFVDTQSILKPLMSGMTVEPNVEQQLSMMARTLISRPNVERAARESGIEPVELPKVQHDALVDSLMKSIQFRTAGRENLYTLTFRGDKSDTTLKFVESLLTIFMQTKESGKRRDNEQARKFIDEQLAIYEARLLDAERALKEFKVQNLAVMPNLAQDYVARAGEAQRELNVARLELKQAEYARDALARRLEQEPPVFTSVEAIAQGVPQPPSELELRIDSTRKRLDELRTRFTELHPDVIGAVRVLEQLTAERAAQLKNPKGLVPGTQNITVPNKVYQDIKLNLATAEASVASLRARVAEAERRMREAREAAKTIPSVEANYAQLNRDYEVNKKNYEQLLARREAAQISENLDTTSGMGQFRTVDPPRVAPVSLSANRPLLLLAALLASIAMGVALAFLRHSLQPTFNNAMELRTALGVTLLGTVSRVRHSADVRARWLRAAAFSAAVVIFFGAYGAIAAYSVMRHLGS